MSRVDNNPEILHVPSRVDATPEILDVSPRVDTTPEMLDVSPRVDTTPEMLDVLSKVDAAPEILEDVPSKVDATPIQWLSILLLFLQAKVVAPRLDFKLCTYQDNDAPIAGVVKAVPSKTVMVWLWYTDPCLFWWVCGSWFEGCYYG